MHKNISYILAVVSLVISSAVRADDRKVLTEIYQAVVNDYYQNVSLNEIVSPALKQLTYLDKNVRVADDNHRVTLYVKGQAREVRRKPTEPRNIEKWVTFTEDFLKTARSCSAELRRKDFEMIDTMFAFGVKKFDKDSNYYPDLELSHKPTSEFKSQRAFYERLLPEGILYIRLGAINKYTVANVRKSLAAYPTLKALLLDLRGNPGGILQEAVKLADMFLDGGIVASAQGRITEYYNAHDGDVLANKPIAILIDKHSASSAEVFAAALQEQSRAKIIGTQSYGKGTMQKVITLSNNSRLALTSANIYTPSERNLARGGIVPDICTSGESDNADVERILRQNKGLQFCNPEDRFSANIDLSVAKAQLLEGVY